MPIRNPLLVTGDTYHLLNRTVSDQLLFQQKTHYLRFLKSLSYYQYNKPPIKFSRFIALPKNQQQQLLNHLSHQSTQVSVIAFCLMPTHFHLLVTQTEDMGISHWMRKTCNSYSSWFNLINDRHGSLFQGRFKAVRIGTTAQLLHTSRYIHINPLVGHLVNKRSLVNYTWSSLPAYLSSSPILLPIDSQPILSHFITTTEYHTWLLDEADFKMSQEISNHIFLE